MKLLLILISPPETRGFRTSVSLAEAVWRRGHKVIIFSTGDGVESMKKNVADSLAPCLMKLLKMGGRLLACRESIRRRSSSQGSGLMEGVEMSSLAEMVELMDLCDKTLVFD